LGANKEQKRSRKISLKINQETRRPLKKTSKERERKREEKRSPPRGHNKPVPSRLFTSRSPTVYFFSPPPFDAFITLLKQLDYSILCSNWYVGTLLRWYAGTPESSFDLLPLRHISVEAQTGHPQQR
jgi:hypothetical protein